jgi:hypothetical protein
MFGYNVLKSRGGDSKENCSWNMTPYNFFVIHPEDGAAASSKMMVDFSTAQGVTSQKTAVFQGQSESEL